MKGPTLPARSQAGFTLIEILTVCGIIGIMAAVALPALSNYLKTYRIRAAAQQVAGEIQTARLKAVSRNLQLGVVFIATSPTTYRYVIQDDVSGTLTTSALATPISTQLTKPAQVGPLRQLPQGVQFGAGRVGGQCQAAGFAAVNAHAFRFSGLGTWCDTSAVPCRPEDSGAANQFNNAANGTVICVVEPINGLERAVIVSAGGGTRMTP